MLELRAILLGLKSLCTHQNNHVRIMTDNMTALAYVSHQGGVRSEIAHVTGIENTLADYKSRNFSDNLEWKLNQKLFDKIFGIWGVPDIDLFASRLNCKVQKFVAWQPDAEAFWIDTCRQRFKQRPIGGLPLCGKLLLSKGYDKETTKLIMDAWRPSNKKTVLYVFEQVVNVLYHKGHRQVRTNTATGM